jgi:hypothetical protein
MPRIIAALAALLVSAAIVVPVASADHHGFGHRHSDGESHGITYAVIGDTPYGQPQIDNFANDVAEINAAPGVSRVIHLGDIKNGSTQCSTAYFQQIRSNFDQFTDPLVYTPGDNEWTDCHRANNGAYWPAGPVLNGDTRPARLAEIHRIFFDRPGRTLGVDSRRVQTQGGNYAENVRWDAASVEFGTLNVPGSNNDWVPWFGQPQTSSQIDEVNGRTQADIAWLDRIFDHAKDEHAKAVTISIQADMWDPAITGDPASYDHFQPIVQALAKESLAFHRPVLLLNGDSHAFTDDRPLADPARPQNKSIYGITKDVPNLRRITVNGSTTSCHEWMKLHIDPRSSGVFSYERVRFSKQPGFDHTVCPEH